MPHGPLEAPPSPRSTRRWTVGDVIDFEDLVHAEDDPARVREGAWIADRAARPMASRADVFLEWLDRVRAQAGGTPPGAAFERGRRLVQGLAIGGGFIIGAGLAGTLLAGHDAEPINALLFFGGTVALQLGFLLLVGLAWIASIARLRTGLIQDATLLAIGVAGRLTRSLHGDRRSAIQARWSAFDLRSERLSPLIGCRLLIVTQLFAIAFNFGLLAAMLLVYLPFVELRFGWQSTYSFTTEGVDAWVRIVSAPWSWIAAGLSPDAAQVAATRYTRGQNAWTLPADAAHAWWPFLLCAIAFYGLTLRIALAVLAAAVLRRRLAGLSFTHPDANALWRRLQGPMVATTGGEEVLPSVVAGDRVRRSRAIDVLIVDEELSSAEARERVGRLFGEIGTVVASNIDDDLLNDGLAAALAGRVGSVVVATSASRDPIVAVAAFLRAVAARLPADGEITLLLCGDATDARTTLWRRFVGIQRLPVGVDRCA